MDNNLQQGADDGLSHTNTANNRGGGIKSNCNGNDASSRKNNNDGASKSNEDVVLPPEVLAIMMEYLPYETVLSCAAVSRSLLYDTMPLIKKLFIDNSYQMNLTVAKRYKEIQEVRINSLLVEHTHPRYKSVAVDFEASVRLIPFLSKFSQLEKVSFGGVTPNGDVVENFAAINGHYFKGQENVGDNEHERINYERMLTTIDNISAAFRIGGLPNIKLSGLCCPKSLVYARLPIQNIVPPTGQCETCLRACRSFPLESVLNFECRGSSKGVPNSSLDVCLSREQVEFVIETRPGGSTMLRSNSRVLQLLSKGSSYEMTTDGGTFVIVKHKQEELDELARVIQYINLDTKSISSDDVVDAIMKPFKNDEERPTLTRSSCYLSEASYDYLKDELDLPLPDKKTFYCPLQDMIVHLPQIASIVLRTPGYSVIEIDCLKLIRGFLEINENPPIQQVIECPGLIQGLSRTRHKMECQIEAATSLLIILERGTVEHKKVLTEAKVVSFFSGLLYNYLGQTAHALGVKGLVLLTNDGCSTGDINEMAGLGTFRQLVGRLNSKLDDVVVGALKVLSAIVPKDHNEKVLKGTDITTHLARIMTSVDSLDVLANASVLLRLILDSADAHSIRNCRGIHWSFRLKVINLVSNFVDIMKRYPNSDTLQTNLLGIAITLSSSLPGGGLGDNQSKALVDAGFVPLLCSLLHSSFHNVANKAASVLGNIADTLEFRELALEENVVASLLSSLQNSCEVSTLKVLGKFCRMSKSLVADAEKALNVLLGLLVQNDDEEVVSCACSALFHLLDGLNCEELKQVGESTKIGTEQVKPLLQLISQQHDGQASAIKCIHIMSTMDGIVTTIADNNGLSLINQLLSKPIDVHENVALACKIASNIIANNPTQIQVSIDIGILPRIIIMLSSEHFKLKMGAIYFICQLVSSTNDSNHIEHLVSKGAILPLTTMLYSDCEVANMAIDALKCILNIGKEKIAEGKEEVKTKEAKAVESKLQELIDENLEIKSEKEREVLLKKKKLWVAHDVQYERFNSLNSDYELLKEQSNEVQAQMTRFEETLAGKAVLKNACEVLQQTHTVVKRQQTTQIWNVKNKVDAAKAKVTSLYNLAEKQAPKDKWQDCLQSEDLPTDLEALDTALNEVMSTVKSIESTRVGLQRRFDVGVLRTSLENLFYNESEDTKKRKADELEKEEEVVGEDEREEAEAETMNEGDNNSKKKQKKKGARQSSINSFFKKPA